MGNQTLSKESLLEKSKILFREKGYSNASISQLASACNVSKSHFYYYFENKEVLMEEVLKEELRYFTDHIFHIAYEEAFSPKKRLKKLFRLLEKSFCKEHAGSLMTMTVFNSTAEEHIRFFPIIRSYYEAWEKALFTIFSAKMGNKKSAKLTHSALLQLEGSLVFIMLNNNSAPFLETTERILSEFSRA